jgi:hypothetical protein
LIIINLVLGCWSMNLIHWFVQKFWVHVIVHKISMCWIYDWLLRLHMTAIYLYIREVTDPHAWWMLVVVLSISVKILASKIAVHGHRCTSSRCWVCSSNSWASISVVVFLIVISSSQSSVGGVIRVIRPAIQVSFVTEGRRAAGDPGRGSSRGQPSGKAELWPRSYDQSNIKQNSAIIMMDSAKSETLFLFQRLFSKRANAAYIIYFEYYTQLFL